jgi:hypothetical protein
MVGLIEKAPKKATKKADKKDAPKADKKDAPKAEKEEPKEEKEAPKADDKKKSKELNEYEHHYEKVNGECRKYNDEGDYTVVSDYYCN